MELKSTYEIQVFNPYTYTYELIETWTFFSNPAKEDTDGDTLGDIDDLRQTIFDTVVLADTELVTVFNTGRSWYKIACTSYDYLDNLFYTVDLKVANSIPLDTFTNALHNSEQSFNIDELTYIGLINNEGSKIYLHDKSSDLREEIFGKLTNGESRYYQHKGILFWEDWKEVPKGTKGGFFKGAVLSEADINFSLNLYYVVDVYTVLNSIAKAGAIVIVIIVATEATPIVLANIQGITYYVKTFGVVEGLKMYQYLGISNLPSSVITWVQWDLADGDSIADDILSAKAVKHPMNKHMPKRYVYQLQYISRDTAELQLKKGGFFDISWTDEQVRQALSLGYREALAKGIKTGEYVFMYLGKNVTVFIRDGVFKTGYGDYYYTYDELIKLIGGQ